MGSRAKLEDVPKLHELIVHQVGYIRAFCLNRVLIRFADTQGNTRKRNVEDRSSWSSYRERCQGRRQNGARDGRKLAISPFALERSIHDHYEDVRWARFSPDQLHAR